MQLASAAGAEPSSLVELQAFSNVAWPSVVGVSANGSTVFGSSRVDAPPDVSVGVRPIRWNASGIGTELGVRGDDADLPDGTPRAASADGSVIGGLSDRYESGGHLGTSPMRWIADGSFTTLAEFEPNSQGKFRAEARDVSADGSILCGFAFRYALAPPYPQVGRDAIRWSSDGVATPLAHLGDLTESRVADALALSGDGTKIGGFARKFVGGTPFDRPVVWSANGAVTELPVAPTSIASASGEVSALSFDGSRAFGTLDTDDRADQAASPVAVLWTAAGAPVEIGPRTAFNDSAPYSDVLVGCSEDGMRAIGHASLASLRRGFVWTAGQGTVDLGTLYPAGPWFQGSSTPRAISADGSTVVGVSSHEGSEEAFVWRNGQMRSLGERIQAAGINVASAGWQSFDDAVACSADGSVIVGIGRRNDKVVAFRVKLNDAPTVAAPTPVVIECTGGQNIVELAATANDANSADRLTVTWRVDGTVLKETSNVVPGSTLTFLHDYPDGPHTVSVEVSDSVLKTSASTTVTVVDTTAPSIVVTPDVVVPTDPGKDHATGVALAPPSVADLCDGDPRLTSDAPLFYPLGQTIVTWRAEDHDGNVSLATQRVTVLDQEQPKIAGSGSFTVRCDRGQTFAAVQLPQPQATDNVPQGLKVTSTAPARFPIGTSTAVWIATDAAGNQATWSSQVTVINRPPVANAGRNITITTKSERGARVILNGGKSSDPDGHSLTYRWSAPGVRFAGATKAKTAGTFPVGSKVVKLTVTDEAGAKKVDSVRVTVKLKNAKRRPRGAASNAAFADAVGHSERASSEELGPDANRASGHLHAAAAYRLGIELGEHVQWEEAESPDAALLRYAEQRELQRRHGELAARRFLASFLESGDEASLLAGLHAFRGVAHASGDLLER